MIAFEINPRLRHEGRQSRNEIYWFDGHLRGAISRWGRLLARAAWCTQAKAAKRKPSRQDDRLRRTDQQLAVVLRINWLRQSAHKELRSS